MIKCDAASVSYSALLPVVLSRSDSLELPEGVVLQASLEAALKMLAAPEYKASVEKVFVIGGAQVYAEALASPQCEAVHLTEVAAGRFDYNRSLFSSTGSCFVRETTGSYPSKVLT